MGEEVESNERMDERAAADPAPATLYGAVVTHSGGQAVLYPGRDALVDVVEAAREDSFVMCLDVTAVDYLEHPDRQLPPSVEPERFELVVTLISHSARDRLRIRVQVPEEDPVVPSLFHSYPGAEALEREVYDMFGITFDGHPDLTRILMPEDWTGHPLRKDYGVGDIAVQFKNAPAAR